MDDNSVKTVERFNILLDVIKEKTLDVTERSDILSFVAEQALYAPKYYNAVIAGSIATKIAYMTLDGEDLRDRVQSLDRDRRMAHIGLTNSVNIINRLCKKYEIEPVFDVPHELDPEKVSDREIAADIAYSFSSRVFLNEMERSEYHIESANHIKVDEMLGQMTENHVTFVTGNLDERIADAIKKSRKEHKDVGCSEDDRVR